MTTENSKFYQFLTARLNSSLKPLDIKFEILDYVRMIETSYADRITRLQQSLEKANKQIVEERTKNVDRKIERSELEQLFLTSIDEVRKKIVYRRLTTEMHIRQRKVGSAVPSKNKNYEILD